MVCGFVAATLITQAASSLTTDKVMFVRGYTTNVLGAEVRIVPGTLAEHYAHSWKARGGSDFRVDLCEGVAMGAATAINDSSCQPVTG